MAQRRLFICLLGGAIMAAGSATAQVATSSGSRVVMDPETGRVRVVNPLVRGPALDFHSGYGQSVYGVPGEEPIVLRKPRKRAPRVARPAPAPAATPSDYVSPFTPEPKAVARPVPPPKPVAVAKPAPASIPFSMAPKQPAPANIAKQAVSTQNIRNIHVNFVAGAAEPEPAVVTALQSLAASLGGEMQSTSHRLLLEAFAGAPGDKSSEARRLSLKRALAVRQVLIDAGVPSERIDVRAMGGASDGGTPDRVDVIIRA